MHPSQHRSIAASQHRSIAASQHRTGQAEPARGLSWLGVQVGARLLVLLCLSPAALGQVYGPPEPPPQVGGVSAGATSALSAKLDAAESAAESIISELAADGDAQARAMKQLAALRIARKSNRVNTMEVPPARRSRVRAVTSADIYGGGRRPSYLPGQTNAQIVTIRRDLVMELCPRALAVIMLHEGWRLDQDVPGDAPVDADETKRIVSNEQQLVKQDLKCIAAARGGISLPPTTMDAKCLSDLDELEAEAKNNLGKLNQAAQKLGLPQIQIPN